MTNSYHHGDLKESALLLATEYIKENGHPNFSLRELANKLSVSHVSLYRHYKNKDILINAIIERAFESFLSSLLAVEASAKIENYLLAVGEAYISFAITEEGLYRAMFYRYNPENIQEGSCDSADKAFDFLVELIQKGMKEKVFRKLDPIKTARHFWASLHGLSLLLIDGQFHNAKQAEIQEQVEFSLKLINSSLLMVLPKSNSK